MGAGWSSFTEADKVTLFVSMGAFALIFIAATISCVMLGNDDGFWDFLFVYRTTTSVRGQIPTPVASEEEQRRRSIPLLRASPQERQDLLP